MYEEEKKGSFVKDLIIKLLYMLLFLFLFMWLYPAPKVDLSEVEVKVDEESLKPLLAGVYSDNINAMKEAAKSYYIIDRLPDYGKTSKMTLQEMLNKKMLTAFVDENGKSCDTNASYVEVTRTKEYEYNMKVYLACDDKKDYINETIGCTSVCPGCVSKPVAVSTTTSNTQKTTTTKTQTTTNTNTTKTPTVTTVSKPETVTVYFDAQGGNYVSSQTVNKGATVYNPTTARNGYKFLCWSTKESDSTCSNSYNFATPVYSSKTLYAQWAKEETTVYEYVKEIETWDDDTKWTTTKKTTGTNVKQIDKRTSYEENRERQTYTYRTVSWVSNQDNSHYYELYLNNIPYDAEDVRITSSNKFSSTTELRNYANNRYTCTIQMVGYGCPSRNTQDAISNNNLYSTPVANFTYSRLSVSRENRKWVVPISIRNNSINSGAWTQYLVPIKFTVEWYEVEEERITQYKYSYRTVTKDYKYSSNKNDSTLLNQGYKLTGNTK
ncbi:MAG: InlB B-repeat-containing protein [Bacilli bacterium]|nr:InlB B-repeat-containing protein [Bacilli bacterium]